MPITIDRSTVVRAEHWDGEWLVGWAKEMGESVKYHRKLWEYCVIAQVYKERIKSGGRALGFGVGREPIAAWLAGERAEVVATDLPEELETGEWSSTGQHAASTVSDLAAKGITYRPVDMNAIPADLLQGQFDFTWSCGSFEHIGGIEQSLAFFCRQMSALRPGGVAVHTTEFNYLAIGNGPTLISPNLTLLRAVDLQCLAQMLEAQGDRLLALDLTLGDRPEDKHVDHPPYNHDGPHLKLTVGGWHTTSVVLIAIRGAGGDRSEIEVNDNRPLKVLWVGDAVASTGFGKCTHTVCDELHNAGHDVHILGLNYYGDPHPYPYSIYPCYQPFDGGRDGFGVTRLPSLAERLKPDVVVLLNDPWNVEAYLDALEGFRSKRAEQGYEFTIPPVIGWLAVDGLNQDGRALNRLEHIAVWTEFAAQELQRGGYEGLTTVVPLGVDLSTFRPLDKADARAKVLPPNLPSDAYIVGVVGRNQPRKRLDLTLEYFAEWIHTRDVDNAYLYLHVAPTGERGCDLRSLVKYYGLAGRVILSEPHIGTGMPADLVPLVYASMDCYLTTTQGEGWGLPALEAIACGIPVIAPDWSALGDWAAPAARLIPCTSTALTAPLNSHPHTIGGIADRALTVEALDELYRSEESRRHYADRGLTLAQSLSWYDTAQSFCSMLESLIRAAE